MAAIQNRDIIIVGQQPWDVPIGSNCKDLALEFSKNNRVLYINAPLDRRTKITHRNDESVIKRLEVIDGKENGLKEITDNLWTFYPDVLIESINWIKITSVFRVLNKINNKKFAKSIKKAIDALDFKDFILFNDNDIFRSYHLKELLHPKISVYYSRDFMLATAYWKHHGKYLEPELIKKSDVCVANSVYLANYCKKYNPESYYVGQGCDLTLFNDDGSIEIPTELAAIKKPILGYVGALLEVRLDEQILIHLAEQKPNWSIVLVGPEDEAFKRSKLHQLSNVYFLGAKKPDALPNYIKGFDVCLNPQAVNPLTIGNYPRKIDEYLAMGKPVIATKTEALSIFNNHIYIAETKEEYVTLAEKALNEHTDKLAQKRIDFAKTHTWGNNADEIYNAINTVSEKISNSDDPENFSDWVKSKPFMKKLAHWMLIPTNEYRPRLWVKLFVNPFIHKRGKKTIIRNRTRMDVLPFNAFELGDYSTIEDFCTVNNGVGEVIIGKKTIIGISNVVIGPVKIGNNVMTAQNVVMSGLNHGFEDVNISPILQKTTTKPIIISDDVWIGANSVITAGVTIGKHAVIGAGSVVTKNVLPYSVYVGNPAKMVKKYNFETKAWESV